MLRSLVVLVVVLTFTTSCISYVTYRKIEDESQKPGTALLLAALEFGAGNLTGVGLQSVVEDKLDGPDADLLTWFAIGNATVFAIDAIVAAGLYVNRAYASE